MESSSVINGMTLESFEQKIADARERILTAATEALDEELAKFLIPADRVALLQDFAKFCCFFSALKIAEVRTPLGHTLDKRDPLRAWFPIGKALDKEVPAMLLEYGIEAAARKLEGTGE